MARRKNLSPQTLHVLATFISEPEAWRYGYDVSKETGLKAGTLYPILMRLHGQGWMETCWAEPEAPGRPPRHMCRLTPAGQQQARHRLAEAALEGRLPRFDYDEALG
jgi:PadR family transcriptional regulator, regulatory protein PadR